MSAGYYWDKMVLRVAVVEILGDGDTEYYCTMAYENYHTMLYCG